MNQLDHLGKQVVEIDLLLEQWIKKMGLNYNHFAVLYSLVTSPNGQSTQKQISDEWLLPKQTIFNICKSYKEQGWILFNESAGDKRERPIQLSEQGRQHAEPLAQAMSQLSEQVFSQFGEEKTAQLFALLAEFSQIFQQHINNTEQKNDNNP